MKDLDEKLWMSAKEGDAEGVKDLLALGANPSAQDGNGTSAAFWASNCSESVALEALIEAGADIEAKNGMGYNPLLSAAHSGMAKCVATLVKAGADIEVLSVGEGGATPLMMAARRGDRIIVAILLGAGARTDAVDDRGWDAIEHARRFAKYAAEDIAQAIGNARSRREMEILGAVVPGAPVAKPARRRV